MSGMLLVTKSVCLHCSHSLTKSLCLHVLTCTILYVHLVTLGVRIWLRPEHKQLPINWCQNLIDTRTQTAGHSLNSEFVDTRTQNSCQFFDTKLAEAALSIYGFKNIFFPNARPPGHLVLYLTNKQLYMYACIWTSRSKQCNTYSSMKLWVSYEVHHQRSKSWLRLQKLGWVDRTPKSPTLLLAAMAKYKIASHEIKPCAVHVLHCSFLCRVAYQATKPSYLSRLIICINNWSWRNIFSVSRRDCCVQIIRSLVSRRDCCVQITRSP